MRRTDCGTSKQLWIEDVPCTTKSGNVGQKDITFKSIFVRVVISVLTRIRNRRGTCTSTALAEYIHSPDLAFNIALSFFGTMYHRVIKNM